MRLALTVKFNKECQIDTISYRELKLSEIEKIESIFHKIQDEWERNRALRVITSDNDYFSDNNANWRTASIFKKKLNKETEEQKIARVRAQIDIWADQELSRE